MMRHNEVRFFLPFMAALIAVAAAAGSRADERPELMREPEAVVQAYLRAVFSRDFAEAYRYVSSADRRAKDLNHYLRQRGPFNGFALEVARKLAALIQFDAMQTEIGAHQTLVIFGYKAPDPEKLSALLHHWNAYRLNSLLPQERGRILDTIEQKGREGSLAMLAGRENLTLVKEPDGWRIFLDWAAGVTIPLRTILPPAAAPIDVSLSPKDVVAQPGELFEIVLRIKNRSQRPVVARIGHIVEPAELADYLEFVQCGFLLPVKLEPGIEQEYSGAYLLKGSLPEGVRRLNLNYDFRLMEEN